MVHYCGPVSIIQSLYQKGNVSLSAKPANKEEWLWNKSLQMTLIKRMAYQTKQTIYNNPFCLCHYTYENRPVRMQAFGKHYVVVRPLFSENSFAEQHEKIRRKHKTLQDHVKDYFTWVMTFRHFDIFEFSVSSSSQIPNVLFHIESILCCILWAGLNCDKVHWKEIRRMQQTSGVNSHTFYIVVVIQSVQRTPPFHCCPSLDGSDTTGSRNGYWVTLFRVSALD